MSRAATGDNPEATRRDLNGAASPARRRRRWLRTGDLGFLDAGRRTVHHRADQGPHHHPRHESLSAGHRAHRAGRASGVARRTAAPRSRCRTNAARRRWSSCRRSSAPSATGSIRPRSRASSARRVTDEHEIFARHIVLIRPGHAAEDHQRQDPARPCAQAVARDELDFDGSAAVAGAGSIRNSIVRPVAET